jgi:hypothetical protein
MDNGGEISSLNAMSLVDRVCGNVILSPPQAGEES